MTLCTKPGDVSTLCQTLTGNMLVVTRWQAVLDTHKPAYARIELYQALQDGLVCDLCTFNLLAPGQQM